jgi:hypothetical protein
MWLDYDDKYAVSEEGLVMHKKLNRILKSRTRAEYHRVTLYDDSGNQIHKTLHVMIAERFCPKIERPGLTCDHINRDKNDNRACNLRWVDRQIQVFNRSMPLGKSGIRHIYQRANGSWVFRLVRGYKHIHNKTFDTLEEAIAARDNILADYIPSV